MVVKTPDTHPYNEVEWVGVAITSSSENQRHVGILYKTSDTENALLLELAWHCRMYNAPPTNKYVWLDSGLDKFSKASLAAYCHQIYEQNGCNSVPYGIEVSGKTFDPETARWISGNPNDGLTCATFVMEVFSAQGFELLDKTTWESRDTDIEWQQHILAILKNNGASAEHIEYQSSFIGAFRFRPEEVASAVPVEDFPVPFDLAVQNAALIVEATNQFAKRSEG